MSTENVIMKVGDLVKRINGQALHSGASMYKDAVVANINPFVLISREGDMRWSATVVQEDFAVTGRADNKMLHLVMKRFLHDFPND